MSTKIQTRILYVGSEEHITDLMSLILTRKVQSVLKAYDEDIGYLTFMVSRPEIVIINLKNGFFANEKFAKKIKEISNDTTVICICDKLELKRHVADKNIDILLEEPLDVNALMDIIIGKTDTNEI